MGLDMYLKREVYVGANYEHRKVTGVIDIKINGKPLEIDFKKVTDINEEVAYWRKANQIHRWFVYNVQEGEDDCGTYSVCYEQLKELSDLCKQVLADKKRASDLLPSEAGFFFGGTEYDEWYFEQLEDTIEMLKDIKENEWYNYHSSW